MFNKKHSKQPKYINILNEKSSVGKEDSTDIPWKKI